MNKRGKMKRVTWCCSWRLKAKTFLEKDPLKSESFCERRERIFQVVVILNRLEFSVGYLVSSRAHGCGPKMRKFCGLHWFFHNRAKRSFPFLYIRMPSDFIPPCQRKQIYPRRDDEIVTGRTLSCHCAMTLTILAMLYRSIVC